MSFAHTRSRPPKHMHLRRNETSNISKSMNMTFRRKSTYTYYGPPSWVTILYTAQGSTVLRKFDEVGIPTTYRKKGFPLRERKSASFA